MDIALKNCFWQIPHAQLLKKSLKNLVTKFKNCRFLIAFTESVLYCEKNCFSKGFLSNFKNISLPKVETEFFESSYTNENIFFQWFPRYPYVLLQLCRLEWPTGFFFFFSLGYINVLFHKPPVICEKVRYGIHVGIEIFISNSIEKIGNSDRKPSFSKDSDNPRVGKISLQVVSVQKKS